MCLSCDGPVLTCNVSAAYRSVSVGGPASLVLRSDPAVGVDGDVVGLPADSVAILRVGGE